MATLTTEEVIRMAREAGFEFNSLGGTYTNGALYENLERFAQLVAADAIAKEREACAKVADQISDKYSIGYYGSEVDAIDEVADAIRAKGVQKYEPCPFVECDCDGNHPKGQEAIRARGNT